MVDPVDSATLSSTPQQMLQQQWDLQVSSLTEECPDLICPQTTEETAVEVVVDAAAIAVVEVVDSVEAEEVDLVVAVEVVSAEVEDLVVVEEEIVAVVVALAAEVVEVLPVA